MTHEQFIKAKAEIERHEKILDNIDQLVLIIQKWIDYEINRHHEAMKAI